MSELKNYLIIGGSSGIGLELARLQSQKGDFVTVASRRMIEEPQINSLAFDVTKDEMNISSLPPTLDGLVYCPGSIHLKPFHRLTDQEFLEDFNLNVLGAIKVIRATLPLLKKFRTSINCLIQHCCSFARNAFPFFCCYLQRSHRRVGEIIGCRMCSKNSGKCYCSFAYRYTTRLKTSFFRRKEKSICRQASFKAGW